MHIILKQIQDILSIIILVCNPKSKIPRKEFAKIVL